MSIVYGDQEKKQLDKIKQGTWEFTNQYLFGMGHKERFNDDQHLDMRTRIKGKNGAKAMLMFRILQDSSLSEKAAQFMANNMGRQAISWEGEGRKEGVAVMLGPQPYVPGGGVLQGYVDVTPEEWVKKAKSMD